MGRNTAIQIVNGGLLSDWKGHTSGIQFLSNTYKIASLSYG